MAQRAFNWVRLDCAFSRNDKILSLVANNEFRAVALYCFALGHSRDQKSAGFISRGALPILHGRSRDAAALVRERLWVIAPGGWLINDWDEYQETSEEMQARAARASKAADVRWAKANARSNAASNAPSTTEASSDAMPGAMQSRENRIESNRELTPLAKLGLDVHLSHAHEETAR